jgi:MFS family permease
MLRAGIGPLVVGPLSEVYGRDPIYRGSFLLFIALSRAVAFAPNIGTSSLDPRPRHLLTLIIHTHPSYLYHLLVFHGLLQRFLSLPGGSMSDLWGQSVDYHVSLPLCARP